MIIKYQAYKSRLYQESVPKIFGVLSPLSGPNHPVSLITGDAFLVKAAFLLHRNGVIMYLYVILSRNCLFKIGKTENVGSRMAQIQSASPVDCALFYVVEYNENEADWEKKYHRDFASNRVRGEWFALTEEHLKVIIGFHTPEGEVYHKYCDLLSDMKSWGVFDMGQYQLFNNASMASLFRAEAISKELIQEITRNGE